MELVLQRETYTKKSTIGVLYNEGKKICYTLEDFKRDGPKVYGETAIPAGKYKITRTMSPRFKKVLPLLHDVPNFTGIRIHSGNHDGNTEGCILVGYGKATDWISDSRKAFEEVDSLIKKALDNKEPVYITIKDK